MQITSQMPYTNLLVALMDRIGPEAVTMLRNGRGKQLILQSNKLSPSEKMIVLRLFGGIY